jgi:hypothetical protein
MLVKECTISEAISSQNAQSALHILGSSDSTTADKKYLGKIPGTCTKHIQTFSPVIVT